MVSDEAITAMQMYREGATSNKERAIVCVAHRSENNTEHNNFCGIQMSTVSYPTASRLFPVPHPRHLSMPNLFLQLEDAI